MATSPLLHGSTCVCDQNHPEGASAPPLGLTAPQASESFCAENAPSDTEAAVDLARPAGLLRISTLRPGIHHLRLSVTGYDDWEADIDLKPGQRLTKATALTERAAQQDPQDHGPRLEETLAFIVSTLGSDGGNGFSGEDHSFTIACKLG